ncbi:MAG: CPBP family intramembrane metalloprotease [Pedobacter sp.]|nr:MAG: CPBP family intramembrane metalloprotease [Pedobacter sp.]
MNFIPPVKKESSPFVQLLQLGLYALGGLLITMLISFSLLALIYGPAMIMDPSWMTGGNTKGIGALKIMITAQQIGLFLVPAIVLGLYEGQKFNTFYGLSKPNYNLLLVILLIMACSNPLMAWVNECNKNMVFPEFLKGVGEWMRRMEDEGAKTTEAILKMKNIGDFLITLLIIAIVPAICEEFLFRGALQRIFLRGIYNHHIAIWLGAAVFSAIHLQFFGFFPRLFLGAAFGYIYYWTGSLWYPIFAHFLNNGFAVAVAFYFQMKNMPLDSEDAMPIKWYGVVISAILTLVLFKILKDKAGKPAN